MSYVLCTYPEYIYKYIVARSHSVEDYGICINLVVVVFISFYFEILKANEKIKIQAYLVVFYYI